MQKIVFTSAVVAVMAGIGIAGSIGGVSSPDPFAQCWTNYENESHACNQSFLNPDLPNWQDDTAYQACLDGASANRDACVQGLENGAYLDAWDRFLDRLKLCITDNENDPIGRDSCIANALALYQAEINLLLHPDGNPSGSCVMSLENIAFSNPMYALQSAALQMGNAEGKYPVEVNTSLAFTTGINATPGTAYNVSQIPCVKSSIAIAVYRTKTGSKAFVFDADLDATDGTSFTVNLIGSDLVDAVEVELVSIYFDQEALPLFSEHGTLKIQDSPITGDWNRDEVLNTQDVIDFLASYNAQTKRADINNDTQVTPADAVDYINQNP